MKKDFHDITILGGGIIGLATAMVMTKRHPGIQVLLLEKESRLGVHQTGHNSGTIHSGIYYKPGSLKAAFCVKGSRTLVEFCRDHSIPFQLCGKVIAAATEEERPRLQELYRRGEANGVRGLRLIGPEQLKEIEPHAAGVQALQVPAAGIVNFSQVAQAYAARIEAQGGTIQTDTALLEMRKEAGELILSTTQGILRTRFLINCGGLHADRVARTSGSRTSLQIVPFRGEYFELVPEKRHLVRTLIYPVPDPALPFLGVHLSKHLDGRVDAGPNAVLALKREGYRRKDLSFFDSLEMLSFPGFWKMTARYWETGVEELFRSYNKTIFSHSVQKLVPEVQEKDLVPGGTGVRAQAVDRAGTLLDDFYLLQDNQTLHVCNAPSPAATASIPIGEFITETAIKQFQPDRIVV